MSHKIFGLCIGVGVAVSLLGASAAHAQEAAPAPPTAPTSTAPVPDVNADAKALVGKKAPDFTLPDKDGKKHTRLLNKRERMRGLFNTFTGITPHIEGTAYGAFQAWTQHHDWDSRPDESEAQEFSARVEANLFGSGSDKKAKALEFILAQLKGEAPLEPEAAESMAMAA